MWWIGMIFTLILVQYFLVYIQGNEKKTFKK